MWVQVPKDVDTRGLCQVSEAGSLTEPGAWLSSGPLPLPPELGDYRTCCGAQLFYVGPGGSNSSPPACRASASGTEPSPQPGSLDRLVFCF